VPIGSRASPAPVSAFTQWSFGSGQNRQRGLAYEAEEIFHRMSESDWHALREETLDQVEALRERGTLIDARPLQSATKARTVRVRSAERAVPDGPFAETKERLGGYCLIEARDLDEAVEIAAGWPSARLGTIEVRPIEEGLRVEEARYCRTPGSDAHRPGPQLRFAARTTRPSPPGAGALAGTAPGGHHAAILPNWFRPGLDRGNARNPLVRLARAYEMEVRRESIHHDSAPHGSAGAGTRSGAARAAPAG